MLYNFCRTFSTLHSVHTNGKAEVINMFFMSLKHEDDLPKAERLYYNYRTLMYTEAFRILQDKHLAEDAVQESFRICIK